MGIKKPAVGLVVERSVFYFHKKIQKHEADGHGENAAEPVEQHQLNEQEHRVKEQEVDKLLAAFVALGLPEQQRQQNNG